MARNAQNLLDMAADILWTNATQRSTGLKNLVYAAPIQSGQRSMLIALVNGAHKERDQLFACAEEEGFLAALPTHLQPESDTDKSSFQIQVVLYECLLGSRRVRGTSQLVDFVKARKKSLQMTLAARRKRGATHSYVPVVRMPRYVRVNHLLVSLADAIAYMESFGYQKVDPPSPTKSNKYTLFLKPLTFMVDPYIPSLLVLPPNTSLHGDLQVEQGGLILQDRSSCLTALALNPPADAHCLDTCSSPGNKTLHLASIMMGNGTKRMGSITALERSENRYNTLCQRIQQHGAEKMITAVMRDFLTVDTTTEFSNVTHILIDPSCSGSGLVATAGYGGEEVDNEYDTSATKENSEDVTSLAREQAALILHAMDLPNAQVIAYSTCSIYRSENEDVVLAVLANRTNWQLVPAIPQWPHRGLDLEVYAEIKDKVCRASLEEDGTNGFFVARFEKKAMGNGNDDNNKAKSDDSDMEKEADDDKKTYKQVKKATKKMLKRADGRTMKYKALQRALRETIGMDKKKLQDVLDQVVDKESSKFVVEGKYIRLVGKESSASGK